MTTTPPSKPKVALACLQAGTHDWLAVSTSPPLLECQRPGCTERREPEVKHVPVPFPIAHLMSCPNHPDELREAARLWVIRAAENIPTQNEILDAAVADFAAELPVIEGFANGQQP
jgi:hypothetical protein